MKAQLLAGVSAAVAGALSIGAACTNPALDTVNHVEGKGDVEIGTARFSVEPLQSISDINGGHADTGSGGGTHVGSASGFGWEDAPATAQAVASVQGGRGWSWPGLPEPGTGEHRIGGTARDRGAATAMDTLMVWIESNSVDLDSEHDMYAENYLLFDRIGDAGRQWPLGER